MITLDVLNYCDKYINELNISNTAVEKLNNATTILLYKTNHLQRVNNWITLSLIILGLSIFFYLLYRLYCKYFRSLNKIAVILPNGKLDIHKIRSFTSKMRIKHGKDDEFTYFFDNDCYKHIKKVGNDNWIFYPYQIPRPLDLNNINFDKIDLKEMDIHRFQHSTVIEKIVTAKEFMSVIKLMLWAIIIITIILLLGEIGLWSHNPPVQCLYDNFTMTEFGKTCLGLIKNATG